MSEEKLEYWIEKATTLQSDIKTLIGESLSLRAQVERLEKERLEDFTKGAQFLTEARKCELERDSLEHRLEECEKALKPFADAVSQYGETLPDNAVLNRGSLPILLGDCRAARKALEGKG